MEEDAERRVQQALQQAEQAQRKAEQAMRDPEMQREWIRQINWSYAGLLGVGLVWVQPFLTADSLDLAAMICVVAFSIAIPILAALLIVNWQESYRGRMTTSRAVAIARVLGQNAAYVGLTAGFWHIHWIAGAGLLASTLVAVGVQSAGFTRLEGLTGPAQDDAEGSAGQHAPEGRAASGETHAESGETGEPGEGAGAEEAGGAGPSDDRGADGP